MMIRVYFLLVETVSGTDTVKGTAIMHDALLESTENPDIRKLIMDTTPDEHAALAVVAISYRDATQDELDLFNSQVIITPPDPDTIRAEEILATSPSAITMPEIWELLRIFAKHLGYRA